MQMINVTKGEVVVEKLYLADTFGQRMIGLMGKKELDDNAGLLLKPCSSVHTCFMKFPLDLVFLDNNWCIVKIARQVNPFQIVKGGGLAQMTLELPSGAAEKLSLGHQLTIVTKM